MNFKLTNIGSEHEKIRIEVIGNENQSIIFEKKSFVIDEVVISAAGRNIRNTHFSTMVTYRLFDLLVRDRKRISFPTISIVPTTAEFTTPKISIRDAGNKYVDLKRYPRPIEHYVAILQAIDKVYASQMTIRYTSELTTPEGLQELLRVLNA